jgi:hypothetical protein
MQLKIKHQAALTAKAEAKQAAAEHEHAHLKPAQVAAMEESEEKTDSLRLRAEVKATEKLATEACKQLKARTKSHQEEAALHDQILEVC